MRKTMLLVGALLVAGPALADLCSKCKDKSYTKDIGDCTACSGPTSSGQFKLCGKCSKAQGLCEHCKASLAASKPASQPTSAAAAIDVNRDGKYTSGKWECRSTIHNNGTESGGYTGVPLFDGRPFPSQPASKQLPEPTVK